MFRNHKTQTMKKILLLLNLSIWMSVALFAQIPTNGLVRYYPFTGTAMDFSGKDQDGTVNGATLTTDRFGTTKSAFDFGGSSSISLPTIDLALPEYTYSLWVSLNDLPSYDDRYLFLSVGSSGGDQGITYNNNFEANGRVFNGWGAFSYSMPGFADTTYTSKNANLNQWYHLVATRSASEMIFYVNNIKIKTIAVTTSPYYGSGIVVGNIGQRWNISLQANAKIDDVRIYDRALTLNEVNLLYNEGFCNQLITVTDELVINIVKTGFNPVTYENSVTVYPNPTSDLVTINYGDYNSMNGYSIKLIDSQGQVKYTKQIDSQESTIDLTSLPLGLYLIQLVDSNNRIISTSKILLN